MASIRIAKRSKNKHDLKWQTASLTTLDTETVNLLLELPDGTEYIMYTHEVLKTIEKEKDEMLEKLLKDIKQLKAEGKA